MILSLEVLESGFSYTDWIEEDIINLNSSSTDQNYAKISGIYSSPQKEEYSNWEYLYMIFENISKKLEEIDIDYSGSKDVIKNLYSDYHFFSTKNILQKRLREKFEDTIEIAKSYHSEIPDPVQFLTGLFDHLDINKNIIKEIIDEPYG